MEKKFLLWIWYYHRIPTIRQLRAESNVSLYNRLLEKYKDRFNEIINSDPNSINPSQTVCEYVILYYERSMRNVNTTV